MGPAPTPRAHAPALTLEVQMKRSLIATSATAGVALLAAACSSGGTSGSGGGYGASSAPPTTGAGAVPSATATTLDLANSNLGQILVDSHGRSVYLFGADTGTNSTCTSAGCVAEWPPLIAN